MSILDPTLNCPFTPPKWMNQKVTYRLDRRLTLSLFNPLNRVLDSRRNGQNIPILMYHSISKDSYYDKHPFYQTHTSPENFKTHMSLVSEHKYNVISLEEAVKLFISGTDSSNSVVITFDDGYRDFLTEAWPVLQMYGFPATVFVSTGLVGREDDVFLNKACLTWAEITELSLEGVYFGSHTVSHKKLGWLNIKDLKKEIIDSKKDMESNLNIAVTSFSCPYAFPDAPSFNKIYREVLQEAGYEVAVTTRIGRASVKDSIFTLKRIPINDFDDPSLFLAKLKGGYDWMYAPQSFAKSLKRVLNRKKS